MLFNHISCLIVQWYENMKRLGKSLQNPNRACMFVYNLKTNYYVNEYIPNSVEKLV